MSILIEIEDGAGTLYASTNRAQSWRSTSRRDRAGEFAFTIPANAPECAQITSRRLARCSASVGGAFTEIGAGIIDKIELVVGLDGPLLRVSGNDILYGLTNKTVGTLDVGTAGDPPTAAGTGPADIIGVMPAAWSLDTVNGYDTTAKSIYLAFNGELVLEAFTGLAEVTGEHFRMGQTTAGDYKLVWLRNDTPASGVYAWQYADPIAVRDNTAACLITEITELEDSYDGFIGRVYAFGAGDGDAKYDLDGASVGYAGYAIGNDSKGYYLEHTDTYTSHGRERWIEWKNIDSQATLVELAYEWLKRRLSSSKFYSLKVEKLDQIVNPGETIHVTYKGWTGDYQWADIDEDLIVLEAVTEVDEQGVRTSALKVTTATADRYPESNEEAIYNEIVNARRSFTYSQPIDVGIVTGSFVGLEDDAGTDVDPGAAGLIAINGGNGLVSTAGTNAISLAVGAGDGIDVGADTVSVDVTDIIGTGLSESTNNIILPTPGTLTVSSTNAAAAPHTHAVTASSDVGTTPAAALLKSTAGGGLTLASLAVKGSVDITNDGDLTVGANVLFVDESQANVGINCAPDSQFSLDISGAARASYWVGPHALQLEGALMICHFDGYEPFNSDLTGSPEGHMGQVGSLVGAAVFRPGKFQKGLELVEATTNYIPNPRPDPAGSTTGYYGTYFNMTGTLAPSSITVDNPRGVGTKAISITSSFSMALEVPFVSGPSATYYVFSAWVRVRGRSDADIRLGMGQGEGQDYYSTWSEVVVTDAVDGQWYHVHYITPGAVSTAGRAVLVKEAVPTAGDHYFDVMNVQAVPLGYRVPYFDGAMGSGYAWSGTAHNSSTTATAGQIHFDSYAAALIQATGSVGGWYTAGPNATQKYLFDTIAGSDSNNRISVALQADNKFDLYVNGGFRVTNVGSGTTIEDGDQFFWVATWDFDNDEYNLYVYEPDGTGYTGSDTTSLTAPAGLTQLNFGSSYFGTLQINGVQDECFILDNVLDATEVLTIYESNAPVFAESSTFTFRAGAGGSPVWADREGLWMRDASGNAVFGIYGGDATKSWGGLTLGIGDLLIGRDESGAAAWHYDQSDGQIKFYGGGGGTATLYVDTDGNLNAGAGGFVAGGGDVRIDEDGIQIIGAVNDWNYLRWFDTSFAGSEIFKIGGRSVASNEYQATLQIPAITSATHAEIYIGVTDQDSVSNATELRIVDSLSGGYVSINKPLVGNDYLRTDKHLRIKDAISAPSTVTGYGLIYIDSADGDLKIKFGDGTVKTIVTDT